MSVCLDSIEIENLRGFQRAFLPFEQSCLILVGKNNSGKTSVLRLLDWIFNRLDLDALENSNKVSIDDQKFLLPARKTGNKARRIWVRVRVEDARRHRRFKCENGIATIRITFRKTPKPLLIARIGQPSRNEPAESDAKALALLRELQESTLLIYVPSFRDASSRRFSTTLSDALRARLAERALHAKQAGAPAEYRRVKEIINSLKELSEELAVPLWQAMQEHLPKGFTEQGRLDFSCEAENLVEWMANRLLLQVSTGDHDKKGVDTQELGSGLQSLLDYAIQMSSGALDSEHAILAFEEPEAFLHPAAQRTLSGLITEDSDIGTKIITTHSPIIVEEASFGDVVLIRDHEIYMPRRYNEERRNKINTALMSGYGAELVFASRVLLVEGEGDRQFFESARRRIAKKSLTGAVDDAIVVPVGSKSSFSPWIQLIQSYGKGESRPIRWIVLADGDASQELREAFKNAGVTIPLAVGTALRRVKTVQGTDDWADAVRALNAICRDTNFPLRMMPVDLESAILEDAGDEILDAISKEVEWDEIVGRAKKEEVLRRLGSKAVADPSDKWKAPWIRGFIGREIAWNCLSEEVKSIVSDWLETTIERE